MKHFQAAPIGTTFSFSAQQVISLITHCLGASLHYGCFDDIRRKRSASQSPEAVREIWLILDRGRATLRSSAFGAPLLYPLQQESVLLPPGISGHLFSFDAHELVFMLEMTDLFVDIHLFEDTARISCSSGFCARTLTYLTR